MLLLLFTLGVLFLPYSTSAAALEGMETAPKPDDTCPTLLIKKGSKLMLFKDKDDRHPIQFANLDEYIEYTKSQRMRDIHCPVLFLQQENDAQGNDVYRIRPDIFNPQGGMAPITVAAVPVMDAGRDGKYNTGNYPSFDPYGQQVGVFNELDAVHASTATAELSDNPMDLNWGGVEHTINAVESGKYDENRVTKTTYMTPKTIFLPDTFSQANPANYGTV
jgi:hypothetical protein